MFTEGLVSLANPQKRPLSTDSIVITIRSFDQPDIVLGGARIPVTKASFPISFRMFLKNILTEKKADWQTAKEGDLLVQAVVCPEDMPRCETGSLQAKGVATLIRNLPGLAEGQTIRAPVALRLE